MNKRVLSVVFATVAFANSISAAAHDCADQVSMTLSAEQWLASDTSEVVVDVNAVLPAKDVDSVAGAIQQKLSVASGVNGWKLIDMARKENSAGLTEFTAKAVVRLKNAQSMQLPTQLKNLSRAGEKYAISRVDYSPSLEEISAAQLSLRNAIYQQANTEVLAVNKAFPKQSYKVHSIRFSDSSSPTVRPVVMMRGAGNDVPAKSLGDVSSKLSLNAFVTLSSKASCHQSRKEK